MSRIIEKEELQKRCLNCLSLIGFYPEEQKEEYTKWEKDLPDLNAFETRYKNKYIICPNCKEKIITNSIIEIRK